MKKKFGLKDWVVVFSVLIFSIAAILGPGLIKKYSYSKYEKDFIDSYSENIPENWNTVRIEGLGLIGIPDTLEVRETGSTIDIVNKVGKEIIYKLTGLTDTQKVSNLVIQPKGLNDGASGASSSYARIMINIYKIEDNSLPDRWQSLNLSDEDKLEMENDSIESLTEASKALDCEFKNTSFGETVINKMSATKFEFTRSCRGNPDVYAQQYKFFNKGQLIEIIMSYRLNDSNLYSEDFSKVINTFIISN